MKYQPKNYEILQLAMKAKTAWVIPLDVIAPLADKLAKKLSWFDRDLKEGYVGDSCPRDAFTDAFMNKFFPGEQWPCMSDPDNVKNEFYAKLDALGTSKNWTKAA